MIEVRGGLRPSEAQGSKVFCSKKSFRFSKNTVSDSLKKLK